MAKLEYKNMVRTTDDENKIERLKSQGFVVVGEPIEEKPEPAKVEPDPDTGNVIETAEPVASKEDAPIAVETITKAELMERLDAAGIVYDVRATKATLYAALVDNLDR